MYLCQHFPSAYSCIIIAMPASDSSPALLPALRRRVASWIGGEDAAPASPAVWTPFMGGLQNAAGLGGELDKSAGGVWTLERQFSREELETIYKSSWAARKFIDLPVEDMWVRGREWSSDDESAIEAVERAERDLAVVDKLQRAMKSGSLFGSAILVIASDDGGLAEPFDPMSVREGGLANLLIFDRYSCAVEAWDADPYSPEYGQPVEYMIFPTFADVPPMIVHPSRTLRFDGARPLTSDGWIRGMQRDWGTSLLVAALSEINHDATLSAAIAHLVQESSIPVFSMDDYEERMMGRVGPDQPTVEAFARGVSMAKSIWRMMFKDSNASVERLTVNLAGMADLMDKFAVRLAAMADIPATRFLGRSPAGLNSTGESDMKNYAIRVQALQESMLRPKLEKLDIAIARHAGLPEPLQYEWAPLTDLTEAELAAVSKTRVEALAVAYDRNSLTEDELRERMAEIGDPLFGALPPLDEPLDNMGMGSGEPPPDDEGGEREGGE